MRLEMTPPICKLLYRGGSIRENSDPNIAVQARKISNEQEKECYFREFPTEMSTHSHFDADHALPRGCTSLCPHSINTRLFLHCFGDSPEKLPLPCQALSDLRFYRCFRSTAVRHRPNHQHRKSSANRGVSCITPQLERLEFLHDASVARIGSPRSAALGS